MIRSRCGNGPPASVANGTASATASETAPRMPLQAMTSRDRALARRARCAGRRSIARIRYGTVKNQTNRLPTTTRPPPARVAGERSGRVAAEPSDDRAQLQSDQDEQRRVDQEVDDVPDEEPCKARLQPSVIPEPRMPM